MIGNLQKFMHGGYFTVILASFFGIVMAIMYYGRKIRNRFITFDKIGPAIPVITALSRDHTLPKFCSQLVYTTHADNKTDIEAKDDLFNYNASAKNERMFIGFCM